jgi:hypothetical protein
MFDVQQHLMFVIMILGNEDHIYHKLTILLLTNRWH